MISANPKESVRALLAGIVDYAGLFPPSYLPMSEAVANYAAYKMSSYNWMLGRFIVPAARLGEFTERAREFFTNDKDSWRLSVLASDDIYTTVHKIEDFNAEYAPHVICDALEVKAETSYEIKEIAEAVPSGLKTYFEISIGDTLADLISTLAIHGQHAKIRTGGVTENAFPSAENITRFMRVCLAANVPFKATAGLHHPLRCVKPLTYEADAPEGAMNGFLNVFLAAAFLLQGHPPKLINELLKDKRADNFLFSENGVLWRQEYFISTAQLRILRTRGAISFGSCSFAEPIDDLKEIGIL